MSPSNYSQTLVGWAAQTDGASDVKFGSEVAGLIYNDAGKVAREQLIARGWSFEGDIYQKSGLAITPRNIRLPFGKEWDLPFEKWGVEDAEEVTLSSSEEGIISYALAADGKSIHIQGLKEGECILTATIAAKEGVHEAYTSICRVRVYIPVERITITPSRKVLQIGESFTLQATVFPQNASTQSVRWDVSADHRIAAINVAGGITGRTVGVCFVTVRSEETGSVVEGRCIVEVVSAPPVAVTGVTLDNTTLSLQAGASARLKATVAPANASNKAVRWSSSAPNIAEVDKTGMVTAKTEGTATITVTTKDGEHTATCSVTVASAAGVSDAIFASVLVSPNPFETQLRISHSDVRGKYALYNTQGIEVAFGGLEGAETHINTESLPAGMYLLRLTAENGAQKTFTVVKR